MTRMVAGHVVELDGVGRPTLYSIDLTNGTVALLFSGYVDTPRVPTKITIDGKLYIVENLVHNTGYWEDTAMDGNIAKGDEAWINEYHKVTIL